jgi:hypothetical protein
MTEHDAAMKRATENPEEPACEPVAVLMCTDRHRLMLARRLRLCPCIGHCCRGCDGKAACKVVCGRADGKD